MNNLKRFYKKEFPSIDDIVIAKAIRIESDSVYVELLEYENKKGMIALKEISERRLRSISKIIKINKIYPLLVLNIDEDTGYIDLSNKYIVDKDIALEKYKKYKKLIGILERTTYNYCKNKDIKEDQYQNIYNDLLEKTLWQINPDKCYDLFSEIKMNNEKIDIFNLDIELKESILRNINKTIESQLITIKIVCSIRCCEISGLINIIETLQEFNEIYHDKIICKSDSVPNYILQIKGTDRNEIELILNKSLKKLDEIGNKNNVIINILNKEIIN